MIDLRSDTLTKPTEAMRQAMVNAEVGDDGRIDTEGKGEDPTVNALENLAAQLTGKEDAMFCNSGSMANIIAMLTHCNRGESVALGENNHINKSEKSPFMEKYFGLKPLFYCTDEYGMPESESLHKIIQENELNLLCIENANSYHGGTCMTVEQTVAISAIAKSHNIPVHLDGARIFNVAAFLDLPVSDLVASVDTVIFCLSKGLGAPMGSMLCGSKEFIKKARSIRKLLGGGMRQAGVVAAAGIIAIQGNSMQLLSKDNEHAYLLASKIAHHTVVKLKLETVQTNIITIDISPSGYTSTFFEVELVNRGLRVKAMSDKYVRMTTYREISEKDVGKAADIFNQFCESLTLKE